MEENERVNQLFQEMWDFKPAAMPVNSTLTKCTNTGG